MFNSARALILMIVLVASVAIAGPKKKDLLPAYVLKASTVVVIIDPDVGASMGAPQANKTAQDDVEKALMKWGRFRPVVAGMQADLVITVRKGSGKVVEPTIGGGTNDRPVIVQQTDSSIRLGGQIGRPPGAQQGAPRDEKPHPQMEASLPDDMFVVYEGSQGPHPDGPPVWHYYRKNALRSPDVPAVAEFRKLIEAAEKQQKTKP
ncbi:MAG TPA: hypothetical protein VJO16_06965 [Candidatus Acidoferrum sp.]|nr:hypothetical protein [Candidatus Acidoferrum sp.]